MSRKIKNKRKKYQREIEQYLHKEFFFKHKQKTS